MSLLFFGEVRPLEQAMELEKFSEFVYGILVSLAWMTHTGSKKSCLSKRLAKMAQQGLVCEQGVFPYSGGESLTQAHTGGTAGTIRLCCLLVFGISSFSEPLPKILFFVYAAQVLHRAILPSSTLIMF